MPVIRRGEARDLEAVAAIQAASPEAARWSVADYLRCDLRVAGCGGRVAGFLVSRVVAEGECELLTLAVAPEFRRQGIGGGLVNALVEEFRGAIWLEVRESNNAARKFYGFMGFQEIGRRVGYYDAPAEAAIVMKFHSC